MRFDLKPNLVAALSEKKDGDMNLNLQEKSNVKTERNREKFLKKLDVGISKITFADLSHGDNVEVVSGAEQGRVISDTDGLLTQETNLYLGFTVADCLPVFLFEPDLGLVGVIHCGWQGLALDILCKTCGKIRKNWGKDLKELQAFIGPGICKKHYEIGEDVAKRFSQCQQAIEEKKKDTFLNLKKVARFQLLRSGLKEGNIQTSPECTYELDEKYYSYRRDKSSSRNLAVIGRKKD